jgi:hypothetical protein
VNDQIIDRALYTLAALTLALGIGLAISLLFE